MEEKKNESQVQGSDGSAEKNKMGSILAGYGGKRRMTKCRMTKCRMVSSERVRPLSVVRLNGYH